MKLTTCQLGCAWNAEHFIDHDSALKRGLFLFIHFTVSSGERIISSKTLLYIALLGRRLQQWQNERRKAAGFTWEKVPAVTEAKRFTQALQDEIQPQDLENTNDQRDKKRVDFE